MDIISYHISDEDIKEIEEVLRKLITSIGIDIAVVGDEGGRLIAYLPLGDGSHHIAERFCVVSASVLGALDQIDNLVQSKMNFFTEGLASAIYIKISPRKFFISVKFSKGVMLGTVKLFVDKAMKELEPIFQQIRERSNNKFPGLKFDMLEI
ncbi:MAG: hypothetical protein N2Z80_04275 [Hydrogenothermaceae bacterium]|nr:hypothetical protein [Hydrogenothermaceae bacterium]